MHWERGWTRGVSPRITDPHTTERARRWRLVLGNDAEQSTGVSLGGADAGMDRALEALYGATGGGGGMPGTAGTDRRGGLGSSAPSVACPRTMKR